MELLSWQHIQKFCIDLWQLNARTVKDSYSLPRIEDTLDSLNSTVWFTALDLKSGYWQVNMDEASRPLMAFTVGPLGFSEYDHMPFSLVNAPATFQKLKETCLGKLQQLVIIKFSKAPKEHLTQLRTVFQKLKELGLKLKV